MDFDIAQGLAYLITITGVIFGTAGMAKYKKAKRIVTELLVLAKDMANLTKVYKAASKDGVYTDKELRDIGEAAVPIAEAADKYI